ncbi:MAG: hypothetical protein HFH68_08495 [Lachnospiraceae bacterium]|nr:hypothetical protein [Lachnospiraceae bacterium]
MDNRIIDWQIMSSGLNEEINNRFILYGASGSGKRTILLIKELGLSDKIVAVVDSDEKKWGKIWMGYKISKPEAINTFNSNVIIIVTSIYLKEILKLLQEEINCQQRICSVFSFRHSIHYDIMTNNTNYIKSEAIKEYKQKYNLWKINRIFGISVTIRKYFADIIRCIALNEISILLCGIQKTGNMSLSASFNVESLDKGIRNTVFTAHMSYYDKDSFQRIKDTLQIFGKHKIKIISGIREPIERNISCKWQRMQEPYLHNDVCIPLVMDEHYDTYNINLGIEEKYKELDGLGIYASIEDWFNDYILRLFDIDIFEYPFDKEKGYSIINKNNISIFIYRLDKLSKLEKEIGEFTDNDLFTLKQENLASEKQYSLAYLQYIENVKIKKEFFEALVNTKGMTHFYTNEECKNYRNKWKEKLI